MKDDLLEQAARALHDEGEVSGDEPALTRARILSSLRERERRRTRKVVVFLPLAAVLIATTALAAPEGSLSRAWDRAKTLIGIAPRERIVSRPLDPLLAEPAPAPETFSPPDPSNRQDAEPREAEGISTQSGSTPPPAPAPSPSPAPPPAPSPTPPAPPSPESAHLALYERAHRLHFVTNDYASALAAWDAYLQSSPRGSLSIEARYNRAIALVRLSRNDEALRALEPFARGEIASGYRQNEARALWTALQRETPTASPNP